MVCSGLGRLLGIRGVAGGGGRAWLAGLVSFPRPGGGPRLDGRRADFATSAFPGLSGACSAVCLFPAFFRLFLRSDTNLKAGLAFGGQVNVAKEKATLLQERREKVDNAILRTQLERAS